MEDNRLVKEVVFEEMEGKTKEEDQEENVWTMKRNGLTRKYTF